MAKTVSPQRRVRHGFPALLSPSPSVRLGGQEADEALLATTSQVAAQDRDITVTFATGVEPNGNAWHFVEASALTFDIVSPKTLVVIASFRTRTVADRAAGRAGSTVRASTRTGSRYWQDRLAMCIGLVPFGVEGLGR